MCHPCFVRSSGLCRSHPCSSPLRLPAAQPLAAAPPFAPQPAPLTPMPLAPQASMPLPHGHQRQPPPHPLFSGAPGQTVGSMASISTSIAEDRTASMSIGGSKCVALVGCTRARAAGMRMCTAGMRSTGGSKCAAAMGCTFALIIVGGHGSTQCPSACACPRAWCAFARSAAPAAVGRRGLACCRALLLSNPIQSCVYTTTVLMWLGLLRGAAKPPPPRLRCCLAAARLGALAPVGPHAAASALKALLAPDTRMRPCCAWRCVPPIPATMALNAAPALLPLAAA